jgi:hypothetical protein
VWKLVSVGNPTIKKKWLDFISQQKKNYAFAIFNQFIVSLSAPCFNHCALTHCVPTTFIEGGGGGGGSSHPNCSAKLNLLCKNGPKRKNPDNYLIKFVQFCSEISIGFAVPHSTVPLIPGGLISGDLSPGIYIRGLPSRRLFPMDLSPGTYPRRTTSGNLPVSGLSNLASLYKRPDFG